MKTYQDYTSQMFTTEGERKYVTTSEIKRFLKVAKRHGDRQYALCLLLVYAGCRISEALPLTTSSLDEYTSTVVIRTLKQRSKTIHRQVPVPKHLSSLLIKLADLQGSNRFWLVSRMTAYRWVHDIMTEANLFGIKATPKGLRHGFAIGCLEKDIPLPVVSKWMGHAQLKTTAIYAEFVLSTQSKFAARRWSELEV